MHEAVRAEQNAQRAGHVRVEEPRARLRRPLEAVAPEGHGPRPRRHDARRAVHGRRPRLRQGAAHLRAQGQPQGGEGRAPVGAREPCAGGDARAARRDDVRRAVDEDRQERARGLGPRGADARRPDRRGAGRGEELPQPAARRRRRSVGARGRRGRLGALARRERGARCPPSRRGPARCTPTRSSSRRSSREKSYHGSVHGKYTFRVHPDAHRTQIRQAVEELFEVQRRAASTSSRSSPSRSAAGMIKGTQAGLEEGDRPAQAGRDHRGLRGSAALMPVRRFKPTSPGRRFMTVSDFAEVTKSKPEKALTEKLTKKGGRNVNGRITTRHQGGGHKRRYRIIDFKRTQGRHPGQGRRDRVRPEPLGADRAAPLRGRLQVVHPRARPACASAPRSPSGPGADIKPGNALPLENIPTGTLVHNVELKPGKGGQMARSAGSGIQLVAKDAGLRDAASPLGRDAPRARSPAARRSARSATSTTATSPAARPAARAGSASARPCAARR